jgi:hypothetical protein
MPSSFRRSLPITGAAVIVTAALALADAPAVAAPHVRPETADARSLLDELTARSVTARLLVSALDRSDVIVYVRHRVFTSATLDGRTGLLESDKTGRFVIIELACVRPRTEQLVTLAHELRHAVEIADAASVVDTRTLSALYQRIGSRMSGPTEWETYETRAAREVSLQVRRELLGAAVRTTDERH